MTAIITFVYGISAGVVLLYLLYHLYLLKPPSISFAAKVPVFSTNEYIKILENKNKDILNLKMELEALQNGLFTPEIKKILENKNQEIRNLQIDLDLKNSKIPPLINYDQQNGTLVASIRDKRLYSCKPCKYCRDAPPISKYSSFWTTPCSTEFQNRRIVMAAYKGRTANVMIIQLFTFLFAAGCGLSVRGPFDEWFHRPLMPHVEYTDVFTGVV